MIAASELRLLKEIQRRIMVDEPVTTNEYQTWIVDLVEMIKELTAQLVYYAEDDNPGYCYKNETASNQEYCRKQALKLLGL